MRNFNHNQFYITNLKYEFTSISEKNLEEFFEKYILKEFFYSFDVENKFLKDITYYIYIDTFDLAFEPEESKMIFHKYSLKNWFKKEFLESFKNVR